MAIQIVLGTKATPSEVAMILERVVYQRRWYTNPRFALTFSLLLICLCKKINVFAVTYKCSLRGG